MTWIWRYTATADNAVNLSPATGAFLMYYLKEMWKQGGATAKSSSDGTTYSSSTDLLTTGASGAGGFGNTSAWGRWQFPDGTEVCVQRGTTNLLWRIKWSHSATFVGGSPAATQTPSATDQQYVCGGGTEAAPTYFSLWAADAGYKASMGMDNAAPYDFWCVTGTIGTGLLNNRIWRLSMASGSYPSADVAPYIVDANTGGLSLTALAGVTVNSLGIGQGYYKKGLSGEAWVNYRAMAYAYVAGAVTASPLGLGVDPYNGYDSIEDILLARINGTDSTPGRKGRANIGTVAWAGSVRATMQDYFDTAGALRYAYFGDVALRWPPGVVPVR